MNDRIDAVARWVVENPSGNTPNEGEMVVHEEDIHWACVGEFDHLNLSSYGEAFDEFEGQVTARIRDLGYVISNSV